jgi:hypothetical protein
MTHPPKQIVFDAWFTSRAKDANALGYEEARHASNSKERHRQREPEIRTKNSDAGELPIAYEVIACTPA